MKTAECTVGLDLGGTKLIAVVVDRDLKVLGRKRRTTRAAEGAEAVYGRIVETIRACLERAGLTDPGAVGVAVPGPLDRENGIVLQTPNMGMEGFPLARRLEADLGVPVILENDVNAGVYGEFVAGAARGLRHVIGIFVGTGIGGGLVLDGRLYQGATGNAGEIGHMILQPDGPLCGCGRLGCVEALASRTAMARDLAFLAGIGRAPLVLERAGTDFTAIRSGILGDLVDAGEQAAVEVVERAARRLGVAMANCVNLLSPEAVLLGGGVVKRLGRRFVDPAERSMREHAMAGLVEPVRVLAAALGDDAGPVGAAALARRAHERG